MRSEKGANARAPLRHRHTHACRCRAHAAHTQAKRAGPGRGGARTSRSLGRCKLALLDDLAVLARAMFFAGPLGRPVHWVEREEVAAACGELRGAARRQEKSSTLFTSELWSPQPCLFPGRPPATLYKSAAVFFPAQLRVQLECVNNVVGRSAALPPSPHSVGLSCASTRLSALFAVVDLRSRRSSRARARTRAHIRQQYCRRSRRPVSALPAPVPLRTPPQDIPP